MNPITWNPKLTTKYFTPQLKRLAEQRLSELDIPQIGKFLYELDWKNCENCKFACEKTPCPFPNVEICLIISINETLPKNSLRRRVFSFEVYSDSSSGFCIYLVEGDSLIATTNEIAFLIKE
ncbi:MAG TPA: hypothetical protein VMW84_04085 [Acidobacteriota bacterium]|nr:hypothetical protein [Acidobacteriota bacterium]